MIYEKFYLTKEERNDRKCIYCADYLQDGYCKWQDCPYLEDMDEYRKFLRQLPKITNLDL